MDRSSVDRNVHLYSDTVTLSDVCVTGSCLGSFVTSRNSPLCCPMRFTTIFHNGFEHKFICQVAVVVVK